METNTPDAGINSGDDIQDGRDSPTWKSVKTVTPLFIIAGIYQKDPNRSRGLDILAKMYCGFVLILITLNCCLYLLDTIYAAMGFNCSGGFIKLTETLLTWIYFFIMVITWTYINPHISYYCSVVDNVFGGWENTASTQSRIMTMLRYVAWGWCSASMTLCVIFLYGGIS